MERYIYDEVKKESSEELGFDINPATIVESMVIHTHSMGYHAPGDIPEEKIEDFKQRVKADVLRQGRLALGFIKWVNNCIVPNYQKLFGTEKEEI